MDGHSVIREKHLLCLPAGDAVSAQTIVALKIAHGTLCDFIVAAGRFCIIKTQITQTVLQALHQIAVGAIFQFARIGKWFKVWRGRGRRDGRVQLIGFDEAFLLC